MIQIKEKSLRSPKFQIMLITKEGNTDSLYIVEKKSHIAEFIFKEITRLIIEGEYLNEFIVNDFVIDSVISQFSLSESASFKKESIEESTYRTLFLETHGLYDLDVIPISVELLYHNESGNVFKCEVT